MLIRTPLLLSYSNLKQRANKMLDEYTVNTVKVSKMLLGLFVFGVSLLVDNTCEEQKQLPYWIWAVSLHMSLIPLLDLTFNYVRRLREV